MGSRSATLPPAKLPDKAVRQQLSRILASKTFLQVERLKRFISFIVGETVSGRGGIPSSVRAMKEGAVDFLEKPVRAQELLDALDRAVARSRERILERQRLAELRRRYSRLTARERQVLALVVSGLLNKQVASELGVSEKTVKVHRSRAVEKMGARSLPDLVRMAGRLGIGGEPVTLGEANPS